MNTEILNKIIEFVETASPVIWQAYLRQAIIGGVGSVLFSILLFALMMVVYTNLWRKKEELNEWEGAAIILSTIGAILGIFVLWYGVTSLLNPQYKAIQLLIQTIK